MSTEPSPYPQNADVLVLQHIACEPPGVYEDVLRQRGARLHGVPVFGACLGAQLLAAALGARAYPGPVPEVGVLPVQLTVDGLRDPVTRRLPPRFCTLQWHSDTFDLPAGATLLASSPAYRNQAFRVGPSAYAVQFHLEVTESMAEEWAAVPAYPAPSKRSSDQEPSTHCSRTSPPRKRSCSSTRERSSRRGGERP